MSPWARWIWLDTLHPLLQPWGPLVLPIWPSIGYTMTLTTQLLEEVGNIHDVENWYDIILLFSTYLQPCLHFLKMAILVHWNGHFEHEEIFFINCNLLRASKFNFWFTKCIWTIFHILKWPFQNTKWPFWRNKGMVANSGFRL